MSIMLCGLRLVWHEFFSEIFLDLSIRYQYDSKNRQNGSIS